MGRGSRTSYGNKMSRDNNSAVTNNHQDDDIDVKDHQVANDDDNNLGESPVRD